MTSDPKPPFSLPAAHPDVDDAPALEALRARIVKDLDDTQGAYHKAPWLRRVALPALALVAALAPWLVVRPSLSPLLPGLLLAVAGLVAWVAVWMAPKRPSQSSRAGAAAVVVVAAAVVLEVVRGDAHAPAHLGFGGCLAMGLGFLVGPALFASLSLWQSRLPLRRGHVAALGVAGLAGSAVVWLACDVTEPLHLLLEHGGAAVAGVVVVAGVAHAVLRRPRPLASV